MEMSQNLFKKNAGSKDIQKLIDDVRRLKLNMCEWELIEYYDSPDDFGRASIIQDNYQDIHPIILTLLANHPEESEMIHHAAQAALDALKVQEQRAVSDNSVDQESTGMDEDIEWSISIH